VSKNYEYSSILAPFMQGLVDEKRAMGFSYDSTAYVLKEFDQYCVDKELSTIHVTRNFMDDWMKRKDTEGGAELSVLFNDELCTKPEGYLLQGSFFSTWQV